MGFYFQKRERPHEQRKIRQALILNKDGTDSIDRSFKDFPKVRVDTDYISDQGLMLHPIANSADI